MNILQLVSSSRTSGAEKHVVVLSERLRQRGHKVVAVCPHGDWLPTQLRAVGIPTLEMDMRGLRACTAPMNLTRFVREHQIELIHAHLTRATYFGLLTGRLAHLPIISSVHCRTHDVAYRFLFPQRNSQIVTVANFIRNGLLRKGVSESRIRTIYNGTEFCSEQPDEIGLLPDLEATGGEVFSLRKELNLPENTELVGLVGRVEEFKGHLVLAQAVKQIVTARPQAYFVCVGPIIPEVQRAIEEIITLDGVSDRVHFTGIRNDIKHLISEMDVLTLPSRYEACSMSIIESMALGKPMIATRAGGNPELVEHGITGLLIERNPQSLAEAVIHVLEDPERRRQMGEAARRCAESRFSARVMVDNIESLYREMLAARIAA